MNLLGSFKNCEGVGVVSTPQVLNCNSLISQHDWSFKSPVLLVLVFLHVLLNLEHLN